MRKLVYFFQFIRQVKGLLLILSSLIFCEILVAQTMNSVGLLINEGKSFEGYTLFSPSIQKSTFLINNEGRLVHSWNGKSITRHTVYLNEDGTLYRTGLVETDPIKTHINAGGGGGRIERYGWDSELLWEYEYADKTKRHHHDFQVLPNGNVLILAWEVKTKEEAIQAGRNPDYIDTESNELWPDHIIEVKPIGSNGGEIVWEWHIWDHLIQDFDETKDNFGIVADHPELIDLNYVKPDSPTSADWNHSNAIDYNADLDQIMISVHAFNELWIIDHSTTTSQAKSNEGGLQGKGGNLLYRWGNPEAYKKGSAADRKFYRQHGVRWIPKGLPDEGKIILFNNGRERPGEEYSSIDIIDPLINGSYTLSNAGTFLPNNLSYQYIASNPIDFSAIRFSSAQQMPNGNLLVCNGPAGTFFEIDADENVIWKYVSPVTADGFLNQGESPEGINSVFHIYRFDPEFPAFEGKDLIPGDLLEVYPDEVIAGVDKFESKIELFPNPAEDIVKISCDCDLISITSLDGSFTESFSINSSGVVDVSNLQNGIYVIRYNKQSEKLIISR